MVFKFSKVLKPALGQDQPKNSAQSSFYPFFISFFFSSIFSWKYHGSTYQQACMQWHHIVASSSGDSMQPQVFRPRNHLKSHHLKNRPCHHLKKSSSTSSTKLVEQNCRWSKVHLHAVQKSVKQDWGDHV